MLLKRNENSTKDLLLYNLNEKKYIGVHLREDGWVEKIRLFDENIGGDCMVGEYVIRQNGWVNPCSITVENEEYLSTDLLMFWSSEFEVAYEA